MTLDEYKQRAKQDLDNAFEKGKAQGGSGENWYDTFWDSFQTNGTRYHYNYAFGNQGWNDTTYNPKYPFDNIWYALSMFLNSTITDTKQPIDLTKLKTQANSLFQGCTKLKTIRKIIVAENNTFINAFNNLNDLEYIEVEGTIGNNVDLHWSTKLTAESYHSIMTHYSKTASVTLTLPPEATVRSVYDAEYGSGAWDLIIKEYSNVSIVYS